LYYRWISGKIEDILGAEDDIVTELCFNLLEAQQFVLALNLIILKSLANVRQPDIKRIQINLMGFLDKDTPSFCKELWTLCLSAQANPQGVPKELLEAKKLELIQEKVKLRHTTLFKVLNR
jgi:serine/arginine repetitive matrix protein 1